MEIELRAFVSDMDALSRRLQEIGATYNGTVYIVDRWYCRQDVKSLSEIEMNATGSYGLRIRKLGDDSGEKHEICCKTILNENDHGAFGEYESRIDSPQDVHEILDIIGFKEYCTLKKRRDMFQLDDISANIEDIEGYETGLELEIVADDYEENRTRLMNIMKRLGIDESQFISTSITNLYMKKFSKF